MGDPGLPLTTGEGAALVEELREALDDPKRGEWGGYPWEHLGDAERDVRVLLAEYGRLRIALRELDRELPAGLRAAHRIIDTALRGGRR